MHKRTSYITLICSVLFGLNASAQKGLSTYVDPMIGSDAHGHVFVGANVPFGAVQLGPVNVFEGWDWCSGYHYTSKTIVGFTHTHLSGTGIGDLNDVLIMPATGSVQLNKGTKTDQVNGYLSSFSHQNEVSKAGYYSVLLDKYKIKAELTATERVGFHRYTFNAKQDRPHLMLDLSDGIGWDSPVETYIKQVNSTTIVGYRYSKGWAKDQRLYFAMKLSQPLSSMSLYDSTVVAAGTAAKGRKMKAVLNFKAIEKNVLQLKMGISPVSYENALANITTEIPAWDFNKVVAAADAKWNRELSKIQIKGTDETKKVFYTALYHTMIAPSLYNDANGDYLGTDKKVYHKPGFNNYTTFSLWDTYRAFHPLYTIIHPDKVSDIISSFLAIYKQQGKLPVWHLMGNETNTMIGYHAVPIIADAYLKGFRNYDTKLAYEAAKHSAMQKEDGIEYIQQLKYIPADKVNEAVAKGLEYAIDDWCIALMAKAMHKEEDYVYFSKRAKLYVPYFDPSVEFMRGKLADGSWRKPFDPVASKHREDDYTEGNAWQYTWLVPQDPEGLIALFKGEAGFTRKLDSLFSISSVVESGGSPDISGLIGQYAQGNEPNHHTPYLYAYAGQPWKTARVVRQITDSLYTSKPDGLCGNEDLGQMSSWYVFSAMGFYPVNPANGEYVIGSPSVDEAVINLQGNKKFRISAIGNSHNNKYIQKAVLNGKPYTKSYLRHATLIAGGELTLYMGPEPSATWGVKTEDRPKSSGAQ